MPELKRVDASCFEDVHALLLQFRNPRVTEDQWRSLFAPRWNQDEGYAGYALTDRGRVVGFLGYLFSSREIQGRPTRFCNLSSWIVEPEYRSDSLKLLMPALKLREHTVTNLTPRPSVAKILEKVGFHYLNQVDPFDGGPYYGAARDAISSVAERRELVLPGNEPEADEFVAGSPLALISAEGPKGFRATVLPLETYLVGLLPYEIGPLADNVGAAMASS